MKEITIYTDGACSGNPGPGGWGCLLLYNGHEKEIYGGEAETTNNRMELTAAIAALEALKTPCRVALYTDSAYVRNGIMHWLANWKQQGWKNSAKKPVKNRELWQKLEAAQARHNVTWHWVKGHSGDAANERVDQLARQGAREAAGDNNSAPAALRRPGGNG